MTIASYEVELTRGDCFEFDLTYKVDGTAVNLTGYSAEMAIAWTEGFTGRRGSVGSVSWKDGAVALTGAISAPTSGQVSFHMSAAATSDIPPVSEAAYQVRLTEPDGCPATILTGKVRVRRDLFEGV